MISNRTPLLDLVRTPADIRGFDIDQLKQLADEVRREMIDAVSVTGGHLGAGLGVVELTVALHHVFDTPVDKLIWDVGHQAYPHKILTGRRDRIRTLRQGGGLSGFTRRSESEYDPFGAAHSSTSISAGLGMAVARDLKGDDRHVIAVIGDGAMSAGMAYEAMNNAGASNANLIVILNDNDMSIAPPVGAMSAYLSRLISSRPFLNLRDLMARLADGPVLVAEGYLFELERRGYLQAGAYVPEVVLEHPEMVTALHREFVHAGSDVVVAFTYYAHREKLALIGREADLEPINRAGLRLARDVARETGTLFAGDICNTNIYDPADPQSIRAAQARNRRMSSASFRSGSCRQTSMIWAPFFTWARAISAASSYLPSAISRLNLREPSTLVRSPTR